MLERLLCAPQYIAPQHRASQLAGWLAASKNIYLKSLLIRVFLSNYDVDLLEAQRQNASDYDSFNDFFTRALAPDARPLNPSQDQFLSPADGVISQFGTIRADQLVQAKGREFSLGALLAGDDSLANKMRDGEFATIYLAPHNYHRVHAPIDGTIVRVRFIPGRLFSVNQRTARNVDNLFARNERVLVELDTLAGCVIVILVGAMLVGSMELRCCGALPSPRSPADAPFDVAVDDAMRELKCGDELGRFNMGSTVIVITPPGKLEWNSALEPGAVTQVGQSLGKIT